LGRSIDARRYKKDVSFTVYPDRWLHLSRQSYNALAALPASTRKVSVGWLFARRIDRAHRP
ncbi:MAG: hypothetical protein JWO91_3796, partial [Acidobacteriaceae bacterium]|nr:hypothetical protein [Acidobacteriaceae bacterium]